MVWGGITAQNWTQLVIIDGNLNTATYGNEVLACTFCCSVSAASRPRHYTSDPTQLALSNSICSNNKCIFFLASQFARSLPHWACLGRNAPATSAFTCTNNACGTARTSNQDLEQHPTTLGTMPTCSLPWGENAQQSSMQNGGHTRYWVCDFYVIMRSIHMLHNINFSRGVILFITFSKLNTTSPPLWEAS
jgi:hypothetical protein